MAEVTFRGEHSWDYYRLKQDGTLEIEAFWKDICKSRFKDLEHYCFSGIGIEGKKFFTRSVITHKVF